MCLPQGCLKKFLGCSGFVILFVGIAAIAGGIYELVHGNSWNALWTFANISWGNIFAYFLLVVGIITAFSGCMGIFGARKKNNCYLCFYQIAVLVMAVVFFVLAIASTAVVTSYVSPIGDNIEAASNCTFPQRNQQLNSCGCGDSDKLQWVGDMNTNITQILNTFGQNPGCQIYLTNSLVTPLGQYFNNYDSNNQNLPKNAQSCAGFNNTAAYVSISALLSFLEQTFQCSGVCYSIPYYVFSNVDQTPYNGVPKGSCYQSIYNFLSSYGQLVYISCWVIFGFLALNTLLTLCLCCQKKKQQGGLYQRMQYYDD